MLNITLCDDNSSQCAYIKSLVLDWSEQSGTEVRTSEFSSAEALLFSYDEIKPDILLLDVEMPGMNGMELAKTLRSRSETAQIIFITGFPDYISQGVRRFGAALSFKAGRPRKAV